MLDSLLPTLGLAAAAALLVGLLRKSNPAFALLLSLAAGLTILVRLAGVLQGMLAGLTALAARVDGASRLQQMIRITVPNITSTIVLMMLMSLSNILGNSFEQVLIMYNPAVYDVGDIINTYVYRIGVNNMQYGYASAVGLFNGFVGFLFLITANFLCRKFLHRSIW